MIYKRNILSINVNKELFFRLCIALYFHFFKLFQLFFKKLLHFPKKCGIIFNCMKEYGAYPLIRTVLLYGTYNLYGGEINAEYQKCKEARSGKPDQGNAEQNVPHSAED